MKHKPVKMIIWRNKDGDVWSAQASRMMDIIKLEDLPITIEKIFFALSVWNAGKIHNEHLGLGEYNGIDPDRYLDDYEKCW